MKSAYVSAGGRVIVTAQVDEDVATGVAGGKDQ